MSSDGGEGPQLDALRIVETFNEHRVRYVVVGGQAALFHGSARPTKDADLVVEHSDENLDRVAAALNELNWRLRVEGLTDREVQVQIPQMKMHRDGLQGRPIQTLMTDAGPLDILRVIPTAAGETPGRDYAALAATAVDHHPVPGLVVKLASLDHIIESKSWADRPKDREALPELIELRATAASGRPSDGDRPPSIEPPRPDGHSR